MNNSKSVTQAMAVLRMALERDDAYAYGWHANIAMACDDAISTQQEEADSYILDSNVIGNDAASRFMKLCFGVETSKNMLSADKASD